MDICICITDSLAVHLQLIHFKSTILKYIFKKEWNNDICSNMNGSRVYHIKGNKRDRERQIPYDVTYMWNLKKRNKWMYIQIAKGEGLGEIN